MLTNYFKIAWRNLVKSPVFSSINVLGLAAGIASCLLILLFIQDELRYDRFYPDADRLYRVALERSYPDRSTSYAVAPIPVSRTMVRDYPEVLSATQVATAFPMAVSYEEQSYQEDGILFADSTFFEVFGIEAIEGNPARMLDDPHSIVLTPAMARKYFGEEDAVGKQLELDIGTFTVTGIAPPMPRHSHFHYDFVASLDLPWLNEDNWLQLATSQYIRLSPDAEPAALERKLPSMVERYAGEQIEAELGVTYENYAAQGNGYRYYLQPVTDIHLLSNLEYELEANGNILYIYLFAIIAAAILLIAIVNYVNIATAQALTRSREVGVRKTLGSLRGEIAKQFLLESMLTAVLSLGLALVMVDLLLPFFNQVTGKEIAGGTLLQPWFMAGTLGLGVLIGLAAGAYPSLMLSSIRPASALKGQAGGLFSASMFRKGLVVFQFTLSIMLLAGTAVVLQQVRYAFNKNLGFEKEHRLVIERAGALDESQYAFMQALTDHASINHTSRSNGIPGYNFGGITLVPVEPPQTPLTGRFAFTDDSYLETYGIDIVQGRGFSRDRASDSLALVINETMAQALGRENPVGLKVRLPGDRQGSDVEHTIVGVMEDFHYESIHQPIGPVALRHSQDTGFPLITVHLSPGEISPVMTYIEETWNRFAEGEPFSFFFYDQHYDALYASEINTSRVLSGFTFLSVVLTCMGLFGLSAFAIARRRKEIGIHKVHGATITRILLLITGDYARLVLIGFVIAAPLAWIAMNNWLENFAYRVDVNPGVFVLAGGAALLIAMLTVSWTSVRAATANPVDSLRSE